MPILFVLSIIVGISIFVAWIFSELRGGLRLRLGLGILTILLFPPTLFWGIVCLSALGDFKHVKKIATSSFLDVTINALEQGKSKVVIENLKKARKDFNTKSIMFDYVRSISEYSQNVTNFSETAQPGAQPDAGTGRKGTP